ncbi:unnamed protein product, partial [Caretta caretta]
GSAHASSKRLLSGSLTCLISRDCGQVLFGTVVGGNRPELLKGAVWLDIKANHSDLLRQHLGKTNFIMVESPAFESYRHVLEGLQEMDPAQVLFQSYVVQCRTPVAPPTHFGDAVTFDLSVLRPTGGHVTAVDLTAVRPCDSYIWSPETFPHLDESQILAIRMALSREFVLIQGPPGTGKTFFGLQIVEILLRNQSQWWEDQRPFLVVCYTNHALDQFMEGALGCFPSDSERGTPDGRTGSHLREEIHLGVSPLHLPTVPYQVQGSPHSPPTQQLKGKNPVDSWGTSPYNR